MVVLKYVLDERFILKWSLKWSLVKIGELVVPQKLQSLYGMPSIASSKVTMTTILSQRKASPGNETLKKRKKQTTFYDRFQHSAGPGN